MQVSNDYELQAEMAYRQEHLRRSAGHRRDRRHRRGRAHRAGSTDVRA